MNIEDRWENKRRLRAEAIDRLVYAATTRGECTDRLYWTLVYDFEHAPITTNLCQLEEVGWTPCPSIDLTDDELPDVLQKLAGLLAKLGVYLLHTNHLTDRELYGRLVDQILVEQVRDLPPDAGVHEFIDLVGGPGINECEIYQRYYATPDERARWKLEHGFEIVPEVPPSNRDESLPAPPGYRGERPIHPPDLVGQ